MLFSNSAHPHSGNYYLRLLTTNSSVFLLTINLMLLVAGIVSTVQATRLSLALLAISTACYAAALIGLQRKKLTPSRRLLAVGYAMQISATCVAWPSEQALPVFLLCGMLVCGFFYRTQEHREFTFCLSLYAFCFIMLEAIPKSNEEYAQIFFRLFLSLLMVSAVWWLVRKQLGSLGEGKKRWQPLSWQLLIHSRDTERPAYLTVQNAAVLFADLQGYQQFTREQSDDKVVMALHSLYQQFDHCAAALQIEKIKTNGDQYMAVCAGEFNHPAESTFRCCLLAVQLLRIIERCHRNAQLPCRLRVGIATGPVTAGYIGVSKRQFDVWGNTVNRAAMLEQQAIADTAALCALSYQYLLLHTTPTQRPFTLEDTESGDYRLLLTSHHDTSELSFAMDEEV